MIKLKYKLFPKHFVNGIIKTIKTSENFDIAKENLKSKYELDDLEVKCILSFKLRYLIELVQTNNLKHFIRRLQNIHRLDGCLGVKEISYILEKNEINFKKHEITDYDYYKKKGSKIDCATCDLVILEITNPNHNQHLEIEIDKVLDSVVDLWFGTYWFEYYECHNEQEFIDSYLDSENEYEVRFAVVMMLYHFLDDEHTIEVTKRIERIKHQGYYVKVAVAWLISIMYIKYPAYTYGYLEEDCNLDDITFNKAIQKINDSKRVSDDDKFYIKDLKRI